MDIFLQIKVREVFYASWRSILLLRIFCNFLHLQVSLLLTTHQHPPWINYLVSLLPGFNSKYTCQAVYRCLCVYSTDHLPPLPTPPPSTQPSSFLLFLMKLLFAARFKSYMFTKLFFFKYSKSILKKYNIVNGPDAQK